MKEGFEPSTSLMANPSFTSATVAATTVAATTVAAATVDPNAGT
ncbi:hypothetical protein [Telluribacter sp. SYSU D00476]|nr:hypothetical protein [Telluribacter sp. SYSU D00476]